MSGLVGGFRERAERVEGLLGDERTTFLIVTGPAGEPIKEAGYLREQARVGRPAARRRGRQPRPTPPRPMRPANDSAAALARVVESDDLVERIRAAHAARRLLPNAIASNIDELRAHSPGRTDLRGPGAHRRDPRPRRAARARPPVDARGAGLRRSAGGAARSAAADGPVGLGAREEVLDPGLDLLAIHRRSRRARRGGSDRAGKSIVASSSTSSSQPAPVAVRDGSRTGSSEISSSRKVIDRVGRISSSASASGSDSSSGTINRR